MDNQLHHGYHHNSFSPAQRHINSDALRPFCMLAKKISFNHNFKDKDMILMKKTCRWYLIMWSQGLSLDCHWTRKSTVQESVVEYNENCKKTRKVEAYLILLQSEDPCFDVCIGRDNVTGADTIVVWQTGTIQANFWMIWICSSS